MKNTNDTNDRPLEENSNTKKQAQKSKNDWRKQLVSGGVYIALAVTVVAVTVSTISATFSGKSTEKSVSDQNLYRAALPNTPPNNGETQAENRENSPFSLSDNRLSADDLTLDTPVSDAPSGIDATVTDASKHKDDVSVKDNEQQPKSDTPKEAAENKSYPDNKPTPPSSPEKNKPSSEEPAEPTFEIGYEGYIKPCSGYIGKDFSIEVPVYSATMYDYRTHAGIDIVGEPGTLVKAVSNGTIKEVYNDDLYGTTVVIAHADGVESIYQGLSPELPVETLAGRRVLTGEAIAGIGNSALCESAEASHLHFAMRKDGVPVNPSEYIAF